MDLRIVRNINYNDFIKLKYFLFDVTFDKLFS